MLSICRLGGHTKEVNSCTFSTQYFVTCSGDKTLRVYSATTFTELPYSPIKIFKYGVNFVKFDKSGSLLASACSDGKAHLFQLSETDYQVVAVFRHSDVNTAQVCAFSSQSNLLVTGSADGSIALWDINSKKQIRIKAGHPEGNVYAAAFTPCDHFLLTGSALGDIRMWNMQQNRIFQPISLTQAHDEGISSCGVTCIAFSPTFHQSLDNPDRSYLVASSGQDNNVKMWIFNYASRSLQLFQTLSGHGGPVNSCDFSLDGSNIASVSFDKTVRIWTSISGDTEMVLDGHSTIVTSVSYSRDGKYLATTGYDKVTTVWKIQGETTSDSCVSSNRAAVSADVLGLLKGQTGSASPPSAAAVAKISFQNWSCDEVGDWLTNEMKLGQYVEAFKNNDIDGAELGSLTSEILQKELGITPLGHRNKIIRAIKALQGGESAQQEDLDLSALVGALPQSLQAIAPSVINQFMKPNTKESGDGNDEYEWKKVHLIPPGQRVPANRPAKIAKEGEWQNITYGSPVQVTNLRRSEADETAPDEYLCPISREIMTDPVLAADGFTYERASIEKWFAKGSKLSPMTNKALVNRNIFSNQTVKSLIAQFIESKTTTGWVEEKLD
ncbi:WD repeat, SAM and U-box domain-containing protein 1 isoform X1 [Ciona intestinalis]